MPSNEVVITSLDGIPYYSTGFRIKKAMGIWGVLFIIIGVVVAAVVVIVFLKFRTKLRVR
jgi:t-SNARE complex subunit (syntaxin)